MIYQKEIFFQHIGNIERLGIVENQTRQIFPDDSLVSWKLRHNPEYTLFYSLEDEKGSVSLTQENTGDPLHELEFMAGQNPVFFIMRLVSHINFHTQNDFA